MSCVTTTDVMPSASFSLRMSWPTTPSEIGSSPANGSSYITSIGSSAIARASATRRAMPPDSSEGMQLRGAAQADGVELHQHEIADQLFGQLRVLAQRERDVLEHRHVGEQRAELEQHADLAPQREQRVAVERQAPTARPPAPSPIAAAAGRR